MATGRDGVKILYASSNVNPQEWYFSGNVDARMRMSEAGGTWSRNSDGSYSLSQNENVNISILTSNQSGTVNLDHSENSANGFMRNITDWRNIEAHFYIYLEEQGDDSPFKISGRGGPRLSEQACAGCAYEGSLTPSGKSQFFKAQFYPSGYVARPSKSVCPSMRGRWVGVKLVIITQARNNVRMEWYIDEGNVTNNWRMVDSTVDTGNWGNQGEACGGYPDQVLDFAGPIVHFKWNHQERVKVKNLAVREIQDRPIDQGGTGGSPPPTNPTDPPPPASAIAGTNDNGVPIYKGEPSGEWAYHANAIVKIEGPDNDMTLLEWNNQDEETRVDRIDEIEAVPQDYVLYEDGRINRSPTWGTDPSAGGSGGGSGGSGTGGTGGTVGQGAVDQNGVRSTYGTGALRDTYDEDFRSGSHRWDFMNLAETWESLEATVYLAWDNPSDDEYGWQLGGGEHHEGSNPKCYVLGTDNNSGATRLRVEDSHPDYEEVTDGDTAVGLSSKFIGNRCIKRNMPSGVLCEIWFDDGDNESKPSNNWKRALSHLDTEYNWRNAPSDYCAIFRMDEGNLDNIKTKWFNLRAILETDATTPFTGSGGSTGGGGGGGSGSDPCDCPSTGGKAGGGATGDGAGNNTGNNTGTNTGGSTTKPVIEAEPVFLTVNKVTRHRWNIIVDPDSCNFIYPTDTREVNLYYESEGEESYYTILYNGLGRPIRAGLYCALDESAAIGQVYHRFAFNMKRYGVPTGPIKVKIFDRNGVLKYECPMTIEASTLGLNSIDIEFTDFMNTVAVSQYDSIVVEFMGGDEANFIMVSRSGTKDTSDGIKTIYCQYAVKGGWSRDPLMDVACKLYI